MKLADWLATGCAVAASRTVLVAHAAMSPTRQPAGPNAVANRTLIAEPFP
jgi:hypothetical protein